MLNLTMFYNKHHCDFFLHVKDKLPVDIIDRLILDIEQLSIYTAVEYRYLNYNVFSISSGDSICFKSIFASLME